jgi:hypothetical protein
VLRLRKRSSEIEAEMNKINKKRVKTDADLERLEGLRKELEKILKRVGKLYKS